MKSMAEFNIFDNVKHYKGKFFQFKTVGDQVQGTYVDKQQGLNSFGSPQTIYVLKAANGEINLVGIPDSHTKMHEKLAEATLGMIVGFKFEGQAPSRNPKAKPGTMTKFINTYFDPKFVDQAWLDERARIEKEARAILGGMSSPTITPDNFMAGIEDEEAQAEQSAAPVSASNDARVNIRIMAINKKLIPDNIDPDAQDALIATMVGIPMTEENYSKIIIALAGMKSN